MNSLGGLKSHATDSWLNVEVSKLTREAKLSVLHAEPATDEPQLLAAHRQVGPHIPLTEHADAPRFHISKRGLPTL
jgi:hypothetical protein